MNLENQSGAEERKGTAPAGGGGRLPDYAADRTEGQVSETELQRTIAASRAASGKGKSILTLGVVIFAVGLIIASWEGAFFIGAFIMIIGGIPLLKGSSAISKAKSEVKDKLSKSVIPEVLSSVFDGVQYDPDGRISDDVIHGTHMFFPFHFTDIDGSDLIRGSYRGVNIEMSDITLTEVREYTETDDDGNTETHTQTSVHFTGQWLTCDFHKQLSADLCVFESNRRMRPRDLIETENEAFNQKYGVSCSSPHDAFYVLTPHMMEYIMTMDERAGGNTYLRFLKEGRVHVAVNSGRNHFEPDNLEDAGLDALRHKFRNEVQYVVDLIDALLKEETLYQR